MEMAGNLESVKKIIQLPLVEAVLKSSSEVYDRIKNSNRFLNWTLSLTESTAQKALQVVGAVAPTPGPVTKKLDQVLAGGISYLEEKVPIVKKAPQEIYQEAKDYLSSKQQKLQNYKEKIISKITGSVDQTKSKIISVGNVAAQPLRDAVQASEKFVDEKLKPEAKALATAVVTAPEHMLEAVGRFSEYMTCGSCQKEKAATSSIAVPAVAVTPPTSGTAASPVVKAVQRVSRL